jgi:hypothetical protein
MGIKLAAEMVGNAAANVAGAVEGAATKGVTAAGKTRGLVYHEGLGAWVSPKTVAKYDAMKSMAINSGVKPVTTAIDFTEP